MFKTKRMVNFDGQGAPRAAGQAGTTAARGGFQHGPPGGGSGFRKPPMETRRSLKMCRDG